QIKQNKIEDNVQQNYLSLSLFIGFVLHLSIIGVSLYFGNWPLVLTWILGVGSIYPLFHSLRQLLEHRDEDAKKDIDYYKVNHGQINRLFGDSLFANTYGAAGFNRHLLHHWEPQIPYTRLKELEAFLMDTQMVNVLKSRQTTYFRIFLKLF